MAQGSAAIRVTAASVRPVRPRTGPAIAHAISGLRASLRALIVAGLRQVATDAELRQGYTEAEQRRWGRRRSA